MEQPPQPPQSPPKGNPKLKPKSKPAPKATRVRLTLKEKIEIIKAIEGGQSKASVARKMKLNESSIRTIFSNREAIKTSVKAFGSGDPSSRRTVTHKCVVVMEKL